MATSPLPSWGPKNGRIGDITPAFSGFPNTRGQNHKWPHHPCLLGGPKMGALALYPLLSRGCPIEWGKITSGGVRDDEIFPHENFPGEIIPAPPPPFCTAITHHKRYAPTLGNAHDIPSMPRECKLPCRTTPSSAGVLARRASFLTISHPSLFCPPLTQQSTPRKAAVM